MYLDLGDALTWDETPFVVEFSDIIDDSFMESLNDSFVDLSSQLRLSLMASAGRGYKRTFYQAQDIVTVGLTRVEVAAENVRTIKFMRVMWRAQFTDTHGYQNNKICTSHYDGVNVKV
ncbi:hypothetical protein POM88_002737 [Heracleum sosnowskyi]|uniref:Uncharacterized protein n=1 Tax=Heracleum sosnowskyi TaxID=360622 RepID=A0AAD8JF02_9APIA|nr:hypothetical protein POM88_002737 [Heracleum sosnowskyi]